MCSFRISYFIVNVPLGQNLTRQSDVPPHIYGEPKQRPFNAGVRWLYNKHTQKWEIKNGKIPIKWSEGHLILAAYAFSDTTGDWNFAPPIITKYLIFGTFVNATPCIRQKKAQN